MKEHLTYFNPSISGSVDNQVISFIIDGFESETTIAFIYNNQESIQNTVVFNEMNKTCGFPTLNSHFIVIAEDVGGSPIILNTLSGRVYLYWFDFDGELVLLFENLEFFYSSLLLI